MSRRKILAAGGPALLAFLAALSFLLREEEPSPGANVSERGAARDPAPPTLGRAGSLPAASVGPNGAAPGDVVEPPSSHPVLVLDDAGRPVEGARIEVQRRSLSPFQGGFVTEVQAVTDAGGVAQVPTRGENLEVPSPDEEGRPDALAFVVDVHPPPDRPNLVGLRDVPWPNAPEGLRLPAGGVIAGRVRTPAGRGLAGVLVRVLAPRDGSRDTTDASGRFRLAHLPQGLHEIGVEIPGVDADGLPSSGWRFPAGSSDAEIVVEAGASLEVVLPGAAAGRSFHLRYAASGTAVDPPPVPRDLRVGSFPAWVHGLDSDAHYTFHVGGGRDRGVGWASFVPGSAGRVVLRRVPSLDLEGDLRPPAGGVHPQLVRVEARIDGMTWRGHVRRGESGGWSWRVEGLPAKDAVEVVAWTGERDAPGRQGAVHAVPGRVNLLVLDDER